MNFVITLKYKRPHIVTKDVMYPYDDAWSRFYRMGMFYIPATVEDSCLHVLLGVKGE
jgi:hypothetical protein